MPSFLTLLLKQRGVTLSELSTMTIFAPIVQVLGTSISGIVADKLGRSKPVLIANLFLVASIVTGILLLPKLDYKLPLHPLFTNSCNPTYTDQPVLQTSCDFIEYFEERNHSMFCSGNLNNDGSNKHRISCEKYMTDSYDGTFYFMIYLNNNSYFNRTDDECFYSIDVEDYRRGNVSLCSEELKISCVECCSSEDSESNCSEDNSSSITLLMAYAVLYILYLTTYSNTYRCFDFTVMGLVKEYGSDFGHERFFSILGNLCWGPIAGLVSHATSPDGGDKNYTSPIYLFLGISLFLFIIIYKIPVTLTTPGDKMWKKTFKLLKNIDVLMFLITIFTLGTCFNFTKYFTFWYLEDLGAPSVLIGLVPSIGALYGLPFLWTSKWWVKKMGTHQIFILSLFAYVACCLGYSFLKNPWISLGLELHGAISYYLLWVAVIEHSNSIAPEGLKSTVIAVAGGIHYSAGMIYFFKYI